MDEFFKMQQPNFNSLSLPQDAGLTSAGPQQMNQPATQMQPTSFDPNALLNPKAAAGNTGRLDYEDDHSNGDFGARSMIENLNGLTSRDDVPASKRKAQATEDDALDGERKKQKGSAARSGGGGILSDHMKNERTQMAPPAETIDLTNDDDEVQILKANDSEEVCLGAIKAIANVHRVPATQKSSIRDMWPPFKADHQLGRTGTHIIELIDRQGNKFGSVDPKTAAGIVPIITGASVSKARFKIYVLARVKKSEEFPGKKVSLTPAIVINVYAPRNKADYLGRFLSQKQLFLTTPTMDTGKELVNPHQPQLYGPPVKVVARKPQHSVSHVQRSREEIQRETSNMFDNLAKAEDLPEMSATTAIIKSDLMAHQKQALHFLMEHERSNYIGMEMASHSLWKYRMKDNGQHAWYHVITGTEVIEKPTQMQGGILADVMGLGKTLSILALIAETEQESQDFRRLKPPQDSDAVRNAKGTLIICPKSVLSNWQEQIKTHTVKGKVSVYTYHGNSRNQDHRALSKYDIVLTSYNTAATEFGPGLRKKRALCEMNWFRIVLDEAHSIRNLTTRISKACCALNAERRWAVTGTPVQNSLTDLGALVKFIRLSPFDEAAAWSQHIMAPFKTGDADVIEKLQILVGSVTLRRMKNTIDLPDRQEERERLKFSDEEALLYRQFATKCRSQFHQVTGGGSVLKGKAYAHVLKSLGRLRAICAHGREMMSEEDMKEIEGDDPNNAIVIDIGDEEPEEEFISEKQAYETFYMMQESEVDKCISCNKKLSAESVGPDGAVDAEDETSPEATEDEDSEEEVDGHEDLLGHLTTCYHLVCSKCTEKHKQEAKELMSDDHHYECQYCDQYQRFGLYPILRSVLKQFRDDRQGRSKKGKTARWDDTTYTGPHTKVKALLEDLRRSAEETERLPEGEPPIRSVVFSGWTSYLDLIEYALTRNNIGFVRIDGSMSVKERSMSLKLFNSMEQVTVMLVSIKAGGQGLNFTAANKAYVMEPQFNPGVEQQAVDRIHRIGQTRPVKIVHYIMENSVEEGILKLQIRKEKLAQLSMEKKRSKNEEAKERMEELKALFK